MSATEGAATQSSPIARLVRRLAPPNEDMRSFALATLVTSIGTGLYTTAAVVFFVRSLRFSVGFVGTALTIAAVIGLFASLPAGRLADRRHPKAILLGLFLAQGVLFLLFPLVGGSVGFLAVVTAIALAQKAVQPVRRVLISQLAGSASRVVVAAYNRSMLNVGMSVGAALAGIALAVGSKGAFNVVLLANAASFFGAAALLLRVRVPEREALASCEPDEEAPAHPLRQPRFVLAAMICGVLYLSAGILDIALPLQIVQHSSAPRWMVAVLLIVNMVLAITLQVRASEGSETIGGAARANRLAGIVLAVSCLLFPLSGHVGTALAIVVLVAATVFLTGGELFSSAGEWGLSYALAPEDQQGKYLASFGLLSESVQVFGPVLAAGVVVGGWPAWIAFGVVFLGAGLAAPLVSRQSV